MKRLFGKKKIGKYIYVFKISEKPTLYQADNMEEAINKVSSDHLHSFVQRKIKFVMSNDPDERIPKGERVVVQGGFFDKHVSLIKENINE